MKITENNNIHESLGGEDSDIETIVSEINSLFIDKKEGEVLIYINETTNILGLVNQILKHKHTIEKGLKYKLIFFEFSSNINDFFIYLITYLKSKKYISENQIQILKNSYSSYISNKNINHFNKNINKIICNHELIPEKTFIYIKEKLQNPEHYKLIITFLDNFPKTNNNFLFLLKNCNINRIILLIEWYNKNTSSYLYHFSIDKIDNIKNIDRVAKLINNTTSIHNIYFLFYDIKSNHKFFMLIDDKSISTSSIIKLVNKYEYKKLIDLFTNIDFKKLKILLDKNNISNFITLIDTIDIKDIIIFINNINDINDYLKIINESTIINSNIFILSINDISKLYIIINNINIKNIIKLLEKDPILLIHKINSHNTIKLIKYINKGKLPWF